MSKRAGTYVALRDLLEEVGRDAVRFTMLTRKADAQMEFDLDQAVAQTRDNVVFYVQYARPLPLGPAPPMKTFPADDLTPDALAGADLSSLTAEAETALIRRLWPPGRGRSRRSAIAREPHRVAFFSMTWRATFICYGT